MTHMKFQQQIVETLLSSLSDQTRRQIFIVSIHFIDMPDPSSSCRWEHISKLLYCVFCKVQVSEQRKRKTLEKMTPNYIKRRRRSQTSWRCSNRGSCCKKKACWENMHC
jgi:hypothetical protein